MRGESFLGIGEILRDGLSDGAANKIMNEPIPMHMDSSNKYS